MDDRIVEDTTMVDSEIETTFKSCMDDREIEDAFKSTVDDRDIEATRRVVKEEGLLVVVQFNGVANSIRLTAESTMNELRNFVCHCFEYLRVQAFRLVVSRDNTESTINTTYNQLYVFVLLRS
ncbi:hypothetical protein ACHQM5_015500 [Ranunculus cassubicifolius]